MRKNPIYTKLGIFFLMAGMLILILSKINYSVLACHKLFGRELADVAYYVGEHIGRLFLMLGTLSIVFMLERYDRSIYTTMVKYMVECIVGILAVRTLGELFTYSIITDTEYCAHAIVAIVIALRIIISYTHKLNKNHGT